MTGRISNRKESSFHHLLQIFSGTFDEDNVAAYVRCDDDIKSVTYHEMKMHISENIQRCGSFDWTGKKVALMGMFGYGWIISFFTILAKGGIVVLIDGNLSQERIQHLLELSGAEFTAVSRQSAFQSALPGFLYSSDPDDYHSERTVCQEEVFSGQTDGSKPAVIAFTSGTTGAEKAVVLTHENICADIMGCRHLLKDILKPGVTVLPLLPFFHMFGLTAGLLLPLSFGMSVVFIDSLKYTVETIRKTDPDLLIVVPLILETLIARISRIAESQNTEIREIVPAVFGTNLKYIVSGGALLREELYTFVSELGIELLNGYGMTECSPIIAVNPSGASRKGTVGIPLDRESVQIRIRDGELQVKGRIVMQGYLGHPEETAEMFQEGWLMTGDLGEVDEEGYIHITGRKKDLIILPDGNNVSPEELENLLLASPLIESVMVCEEETMRNSYLVAHVYPGEEPSAETEELRKQIEAFVRDVNKTNPAYKRIQKIYYTDRDFEKNILGKVKRFRVNFQ